MLWVSPQGQSHALPLVADVAGLPEVPEVPEVPDVVGVPGRTQVMSEKPLDVVLNESVKSIPGFLRVNKRGALVGKVVDAWRCVFKHAGVQAQYRLLPNLRAVQELLSDDADFHGSRVTLGKSEKAFEGQLPYTDGLLIGYEVLLARAADKPMLNDDLWWRQKVGVLRAEVVNSRVAAMGGEVALQATNRDQALKLLVGKRVDVLLYASERTGESFTSYEGHELTGRTLNQLDGRGMLSAARHRESPELLARINSGISHCKSLFFPR